MLTTCKEGLKVQLNEHFCVQMPKFLSIFFCNAGMVRLVTLVDTLTEVVDTGGVVYDANDYSASSNYSNVMSKMYSMHL